ncbi:MULTISPECIES: tripartite tricarboxylate transporter substrate binding protein [unclassified Chelatococcus]|uniref:Bug family tripartite tricarboxylate transporter substrate binding protein n=1 Tax=unclassified Chelatococcus TaxID=2638111 RepID=UPI001BCE39D4|nr:MULTISPECIES: tripartite tricarboxylate transporter substrate binding protein [unclassified Chelatococcus]MBS7699959.1 tripartite tricarboxylate transporter substrate binding protein [Chelatococcus sp. YT9]MBX3558616.1 tripartite tricarboxylate transporter substrate binding protein [Chelatococcus sp.]
MIKRRALLVAGATLALVGSIAGASAADFPTKPVKLVIPYPPGGPTDLVGRLVAQRLSDLWKQPVVVDNKAGASGTIGSDAVARAEPDGYTLVLGNNASHGAYELLNPSVTPYHTMKDFAPVSLVGVAPLVMIINKNVPAKDIKEFVAYVKANPGKVNYASAAIGSAPHFASEMLNIAAGIDMKHIPFNGTAPAIQALLSDSVQVYMGGVSSVMPHVQAGKATLIGAVASERISALPDVKTIREEGVDVAYDSWYGLLAPAKVPPAVLDKINADVSKVLAGDDVKTEMAKLGFERKLGTRAEFTTMLEGEVDRTKKLLQDAKIAVK